ncbi:unnamed protein product [Brassica rapa]|uniref:Uncharacterized protein n=1 Tax=Brassica campestris TaxID=3711 RepID=A0A8D9DNL3_BRACM|nr:unnamed protein product [Brassica rapa]
MLPLQIHPIKLLMKSINHDLAFNASFFCAKRCICEYIKSGRCSATVEVSLRFSEASNVISRWRWTIMKATINSNRRPALSIKHSTFIQATVYQHLIKTEKMERCHQRYVSSKTKSRKRSRRSLENQKLNFPYSGLLIISFNALKINLWSLGLLATVLYKWRERESTNHIVTLRSRPMLTLGEQRLCYIVIVSNIVKYMQDSVNKERREYVGELFKSTSSSVYSKQKEKNVHQEKKLHYKIQVDEKKKWKQGSLPLEENEEEAWSARNGGRRRKSVKSKKGRRRRSQGRRQKNKRTNNSSTHYRCDYFELQQIRRSGWRW